MTQIKFEDVAKQGHSANAQTSQQYIAEEVFRAVSSLFKENTEDFQAFAQPAQDRGYFDVKITIDGKEFEPELMGIIYEHIDEFIEQRASIMAAEKFKDVIGEVDALGNIVIEAKEKILEKYNIKEK